MKLEKIRARLQEALAGDLNELHRLARDLGHELPRKRLEALGYFRFTIATNEPPTDQYVKGFLDALCDVAAAYEAAVKPEIEEQEAVNFLRERGFVQLVLALSERTYATAEFLQTYECLLAKTAPGSLKEMQDMLGVLCQLGLVETFGSLPHYRFTLREERVVERLKNKK